MRGNCCFRYFGLLVWAFLLAASARADDDPPAKPSRRSPPGCSRIMRQLRDWFLDADRNGDHYLDKAELARAFRGPTAKPYDYDPKVSEKEKADKKAGKPATVVLPDPAANYKRYVDYQFLKLLDSNHDGKISRDEFEVWARVCAVQIKAIEDLEKRIASTEARLLKATSATTKKRRQAELRRHQEALAELLKELKAYETHIHKTLKAEARKAEAKKTEAKKTEAKKPETK